jgi:hypothetical protein
MLMDERLEFADDVSVAAAAGTALIGDVIDLDPASVSPNTTVDLEGSDLYLVLQTGSEEVITAGAAGTLQFSLVSDALATLGGGVVANCTVHYQTPALVTDDSAANDSKFNVGGLIACIKLPSGSYEKYLGILATTGTTTTTAGKINAFLTSDPALYRAYADNVA